MKKLMIAAPASGSGKTLFTCGLLQALLNRGLRPTAFKCGPDYIDPMFHQEVLGVKSYNLDTFLWKREGVREIFETHAEFGDVAILEGVMGYYDGIGGISTDASAFDVATTTKTPAVLLINGKGASLSLLPLIKGFLEYEKESMIRGVVFNRISPMIYPRLKKMVETKLKIPVYGYLPVMENVNFESRYLGLKLPAEVDKIREKIKVLGEQVEKTVDVDGLLEMGEADACKCLIDKRNENLDIVNKNKVFSNTIKKKNPRKLRIGISKDEAFCFIYEDNLEVLKELGAELVPISPLHDKCLLKDLDGIILYGGYPELYGRELAENESFRQDLYEALRKGLPCMAECGGFMYLQNEIVDRSGETFSMVGYLKGKSFATPSLKRFGYVTLSDGKVFGKEVGEIPVHEFHYFDSEYCGDAFLAKKPLSEKSWNCMISEGNLLAGYPHLAYRGNIKVVKAFLGVCEEYKKQVGNERNHE